ncbi:Uncharacterised protein [uncultured archaeon]|nr:Uncharacterised protein [uncultured archaeon]
MSFLQESVDPPIGDDNMHPKNKHCFGKKYSRLVRCGVKCPDWWECGLTSRKTATRLGKVVV